jgi:hypothetical protein
LLQVYRIKKVWDDLAHGNAAQRKFRKGDTAREKTADKGISTKRKWFDDYMTSLGFVWVPTMFVGQGCKVHLREGELPMGRLVVSVSRHMCAVIDGVSNDTHDSSRSGNRCVYGYYIKK